MKASRSNKEIKKHNLILKVVIVIAKHYLLFVIILNSYLIISIYKISLG